MTTSTVWCFTYGLMFPRTLTLPSWSCHSLPPSSSPETIQTRRWASFLAATVVVGEPAGGSVTGPAAAGEAKRTRATSAPMAARGRRIARKYYNACRGNPRAGRPASGDQPPPHRAHGDGVKAGGQDDQPGRVADDGPEVRPEHQRPRDLHEVVERREPRHGRYPAGQLVERIEDPAEQEQRRDEQREVEREEVDPRREGREGHAEHRETRAAERKEDRHGDRPRRPHEAEGRDDEEERGPVDHGARRGPGDLADQDVLHLDRGCQEGVEQTLLLHLEERVPRRLEGRRPHHRRGQKPGGDELLVRNPLDGREVGVEAAPQCQQVVDQGEE